MWLQACAPVERGGPWCPTFALRWLENLSFFFSYKYTGCHGFHSFRALGSLQFSLEHSLVKLQTMLVSSLLYVIFGDALMTSQGLLGFYSIFVVAKSLRWHCRWLLVLFQISYLFNSDGWPPILFFIQKRQTYCSWWVYIRVKDWRFKFTWKSKRYTVYQAFIS